MLDRRRAADEPDTVTFPAVMRAACDRHPEVADAKRFREWCDEYFWLKHRDEPRGIDGIFLDGLNSGGDAENSAFRIGLRFRAGRRRELHPDRRNVALPWSYADREEQLVRRRRFVEFNLLYDRGTILALKTEGNLAPHPLIYAAYGLLAVDAGRDRIKAVVFATY
jgi:coproporphyrinogen III oxidase